MFDGGEYFGTVFDNGSLQLDERGNATAPGPGDPPVESFASFIVGKLEDDAQSLFEVVGAPERRVGLHDPSEFDRLTFGQVLRVLPECVARVLERDGASAVGARRCATDGMTSSAFGLVALGSFASVVPRTSTHLVEGIGGPAHHVERISAAHRVGTTLRHHEADPFGPICGNVGDLGAAFLTEGVEERGERRPVAARCGPDEATAVVVDDHGQILVPALVGDLVDTDAS